MAKEEIKLTMVLDGDVRGLAEHRLNMEEFGSSLVRLHDALVWTASSMISKASGSSYGKFGSPKSEARTISLELCAVRDNCTALDFAITPAHQIKNLALFNDLHERAAKQLLEDIKQESEGIQVNLRVRRFLESLPDGLEQQVYSLEKEGVRFFAIEIGKPQVESSPVVPGELIGARGWIAGVNFPPGRSDVRLFFNGTYKTFAATPEHVEQALLLRAREVFFLALVREESPRYRLLWIRPGDTSLPAEDDHERTEYLFKRWAGVLRRLAE